jgi:phage baseplate assembly protein W
MASSKTTYLVSPVAAINFCPETVAEEVVQNVRTIVATMVGTVPLDRDFGFSWEAVDRPLPVAQMLVKSAVYEAVQKYEPRAVIDGITWEDDGASDTMDGLLHPTLTISLADGVDGDAPTVTEQEDTIMDADATTAGGMELTWEAVQQMVQEAVASALAAQDAGAQASVTAGEINAALIKLRARIDNIYKSTTATLDDVPEDASKGGLVVLRKDE